MYMYIYKFHIYSPNLTCRSHLSLILIWHYTTLIKHSITPALSCIESYKESRRVNLIWTVRDPAMLVFFLENAKLDERGLNFIFYTGKEDLPETIENFNVTAHLKIIHKRPDLSVLIPKIIAHFERRGANTVSFNKNTVHSKDKNSPILEDVEFGSGLSSELEQDISQEPVLPTSTIAALEENAKKIKTSGKRHSVWTTNSQQEEWDADNEPPQPIETSAQFVKTGVSDKKLEHWGLMYCGSRNPLLTALIKESKALNIPLHEEAFDW